MQEDLNKLLSCTQDGNCCSTFCKVMHFGRRNERYNCQLDTTILDEVTQEKDL